MSLKERKQDEIFTPLDKSLRAVYFGVLTYLFPPSIYLFPSFSASYTLFTLSRLCRKKPKEKNSSFLLQLSYISGVTRNLGAAETCG
jgi:hypothetical protein